MPSFPSHSDCQSLLGLHGSSAVTACVHIVLFLVTLHESSSAELTLRTALRSSVSILSTAKRDRGTGLYLLKVGVKSISVLFFSRGGARKWNKAYQWDYQGVDKVLCLQREFLFLFHQIVLFSIPIRCFCILRPSLLPTLKLNGAWAFNFELDRQSADMIRSHHVLSHPCSHPPSGSVKCEKNEGSKPWYWCYYWRWCFGQFGLFLLRLQWFRL